MYISLSTKPELQISDKNDRNKVLDWQWVKSKNLFFVQYPVDLDILTFGLTSSTGREDKLLILVDDPAACTDVAELTDLVANLLWRDIFHNESNSYLCNRNTEKDKLAKDIVFYFSMVWVGYDLTCSYFQKKTKVESIKESGPVIITYVCFVIALFYPLIFKILNLKSVIQKLKVNIEKGKCDLFDNNYLKSYEKGDTPFGIQRFILKFFYQIKHVPCKDEKEIMYSWNLVQNIASCRLVTVLYIVLCAMSAYRYYMGTHPSLSYGSSTEYPDVYRVGLLDMLFLRGNIVLDVVLYFGLLFVGHLLLKIAYVTMCGRGTITETEDVNFKDVTVFNVRPISTFIRHDRFSHFFTMRFIERFVAFISSRFWSTLWEDVKDNIPKLNLVFFLTFVPSVVFYFLTCCFPVFWLVFYGSFELTQSALKRNHSDSNRKQSYWCTCLCTIVVPCLFLFCLVIMMLSQWVILCSIVFLLRSITYIIFVAFTVNLQYMRILIVAVTSTGYLLSFSKNAVSEYKHMLDFVFEVKEELELEQRMQELIFHENNCELIDDQSDPTRKQLTNVHVPQHVVYEYEFDAIIDEFSNVRQKVFWTIFKVIISCGLLLVATKILVLNHNFELITADYFFKIAVIVISPKLLFDCFPPPATKHNIEEHRDRVKEILKKTKPGKIYFKSHEKEGTCCSIVCLVLERVFTFGCDTESICWTFPWDCFLKCCYTKCCKRKNEKTTFWGPEEENEECNHCICFNITKSDDSPSACICPIPATYCCCKCNCKVAKQQRNEHRADSVILFQPLPIPITPFMHGHCEKENIIHLNCESCRKLKHIPPCCVHILNECADWVLLRGRWEMRGREGEKPTPLSTPL